MKKGQEQGQVYEQDLVKDKRVVEEINRHLWIESEKAGHDIGFDQAKVDWLENFSKSWMQYYMPEKKSSPQRNLATSQKSTSKTSRAKAKAKKIT